jgi:hypothetical protein
MTFLITCHAYVLMHSFRITPSFIFCRSRPPGCECCYAGKRSRAKSIKSTESSPWMRPSQKQPTGKILRMSTRAQWVARLQSASDERFDFYHVKAEMKLLVRSRRAAFFQVGAFTISGCAFKVAKQESIGFYGCRLSDSYSQC